VARALLSWLVYPVLTAGGVYAAWLLLSAGVPLAQSVIAVTVVAAGFVIALERLLPYSREWQHVLPDVPTDAGHLILGNTAAELIRLLMIGPLLALSAFLAGVVGSPLWPAHLPMIAQLFLALAIAEFGGYWGHRLMHERPLLFRMHAVHHSAHRIYFLTGARNHAAEVIFLAALALFPLLVLGAGEVVIGLVAGFSGIHYMLQHANIDIRLGPFKYIINGPEMHRFHHSRDLTEANANYSGVLLLWDWVFGTIFRPPPGNAPPIDVGLTDMPAFPQGFWGQLASPFRRSLWK
jgi:sterol desaturase/sphingolipid hydroxylase (fatty acid hydroxylase superfamily)